MTSQPLNSSQYKAGQRREWDSAAAGWKKWWETIERGMQKVSDRMVELAEVRPGQRVLDIATGLGEPALTAARRVGPQGRVVGTDLSPGMLAIAQERANALGFQNVEWRDMDAEGLDFPDGSFHAALCRFGLMFLPNPTEALGRVRRLLAPDGRFSAAVWSVPPRVPLLSLPMGVMQKVLQMPPPPVTGPGPFSLAAAGVVEQTFAKAGFLDVHAENITMIVEFPSVQMYISHLQDVVPPIRAVLSQHPAQRQAEVWQAIAKAAEQLVQPDGSLRISNEAMLVVGRR